MDLKSEIAGRYVRMAASVRSVWAVGSHSVRNSAWMRSVGDVRTSRATGEKCVGFRAEKLL